MAVSFLGKEVMAESDGETRCLGRQLFPTNRHIFRAKFE